jgi:hypothetical protein
MPPNSHWNTEPNIPYTNKSPTKTVNRPSPEFVNRALRNIYTKNESLFSLVSLDTSDSNVLWFETQNVLIGFANTHRFSLKNEPLWEVIFAANIVSEPFMNLQESIERAALLLPSEMVILFASNGLSRGNLTNPGEKWVSGNSGFLTTHVYNWMPPEFFYGQILFPHSCI